MIERTSHTWGKTPHELQQRERDQLAHWRRQAAYHQRRIDAAADLRMPHIAAHHAEGLRKAQVASAEIQRRIASSRTSGGAR